MFYCVLFFGLHQVFLAYNLFVSISVACEWIYFQLSQMYNRHVLCTESYSQFLHVYCRVIYHYCISIVGSICRDFVYPECLYIPIVADSNKQDLSDTKILKILSLRV